jgi:Ca2+-binding RTX toxin-like protein
MRILVAEDEEDIKTMYYSALAERGHEVVLTSDGNECLIPHAYGELGNDRIISAGDFASGGSGSDFIQFFDCSGVAYGDSGNDELRSTAEHGGIELHGGSGSDKVVGESADDLLFGDGDNDILTGRGGADSFSCGAGRDTITDFNAAEGDTKTADCENF